MKKRFNITGICVPERHYMMDTSNKIKGVMDFVEYGKYFTINRPRQYGKTTTLHYITHLIEQKEGHIALRMSFQGVDGKWHKSDEAFAEMFMRLLVNILSIKKPGMQLFLNELTPTVIDMDTLSTAITKIVHTANAKIVLLIDEVDASTNYLPFLNFLAMLRTKYLERFETYHATFHSIVLAGVHDIKNLKYKKEHSKNAEFNSPWNIAADFKVRMSFIAPEIVPMLEEYSKAEGVSMDIPVIAERLYYHTAGYPFLVSKLCKTIAEDILPTKDTEGWTLQDVEESVQMLLKENNTNFDSLIKNLENNQELYGLVHRVIIDGETVPYSPDEPLMQLGRMYGIFKSNGNLKIHNRVYEQRIYNYMTAKAIVGMAEGNNYGGHFLLENNALDLKAALLKFQQFMKEQYSEKSKGFVEREGRILFLAFLAPVLNGQGYSFREVQTSLEKRLDIIVTFFQHRYIIELKRWYGPAAHKKGLDQLAGYLDIHNMDEGFLVIFDDRKKKGWGHETILHSGKSVFAVWV